MWQGVKRFSSLRIFAYFSLIRENLTFEKLAFKLLILLNEGLFF